MSTDSIKFTSEYIPEDNSNNSNNINHLNHVNPKKDPIPFWGVNPNILFQNQYITEFFPVNGMSFNQNLNAISRSIILLSVVGFLLTRNFNFFGALTITMIAIYFYYQTQRPKSEVEGLSNAGLAIVGDPSYNKKGIVPGVDGSNSVFDKATPSNPYSNVLLTDYDMNPNKKPAPPAGTTVVYNTILENAKKTVMELNSDQPDIADKLFRDLGENLEFEQSMRNFTSNPATTIPNDQAAFAEFCYGGMISCKEGNAFACARNLDRHTN